MSFVWFADKSLKIREQIAREPHAAALARRQDQLANVVPLMTISTEVGHNDSNDRGLSRCPWNRTDPQTNNLQSDLECDEGPSSGYFEQQALGDVFTAAAALEPDSSRRPNALVARTRAAA